MRILLLAPDGEDGLETELSVWLPPAATVIRPVTRTQRELQALLQEVDIVIGDWSGELALGAQEAALAAHLRLIQQPGVGYDYVDVPAWRRVGVPVANTPGANAPSVAEWAVVAAATLSRSMGWAHDRMRQGAWPQREILDNGCRDLSDRRVGIVGFGAIGQRCATLFEAFGCEVAYTASGVRTGDSDRYRPLDTLIAQSDVLVVAVPLAAATRGLLSAERLGRLPAGAIVVNVSRGPIIDNLALVDALEAGRLGGAALDVFDQEPLAPDSPLRTVERLLLSPHVAGGSATARQRLYSMAAENVARACRGESPLWTL